MEQYSVIKSTGRIGALETADTLMESDLLKSTARAKELRNVYVIEHLALK